MQKVRGQHYVWAHHLRAWENNGKIYCLRDKKIFSTSAEKVLKKRDFYRVKKLSSNDIKFIKSVINTSNKENLKSFNKYTLDYFDLISKVIPLLDYKERIDEEFYHYIDKIINDGEEKLHCYLENKGLRYLNELRKGSYDFCKDEAMLPDFYMFLSAQYFRTKAIEKRALNHTDYPNTVGVLRHIFANNIAYELYMNRRSYRIVILDNQTEIPFITADQPIINIHGGIDPDRLALYYPVSPQKALLILDEPGENSIQRATAETAIHYNQKMQRSAYEIVISSKQEPLEKILSSLPLTEVVLCDDENLA